MINFFRAFFQSKLGLGLTIGFLVLIALAFAAGDIGNTGTFGGLSGTNSVAVVGDEDVTTAELRESTNNALRQVQAENPSMTMESFLAEDGLKQVLETLLDRASVTEFGKMLGLRAGKNLINSEIQMIPAFRGPDGNFSDDVYRATLRGQGLTDQIVREDLASGLIARQVLIPAVFGTKFPDSMVNRYVSQLKEQREGSIGLVPAAAYAPEGDPTGKQLQAFYKASKADFRRPERRQIRYAEFGPEAISASIEPTDAQIAKRYKDNAAAYSAREERTFTQVIVPTKQAAESFSKRIGGGASIGQVAEEAGLETAKIGPVTKEDLTRSANSAVADAAFSAPDGGLAQVARSALGYHVIQIDDVKRTAARTLDQVRSEIADELRAGNQRTALTELAAEIENRINSGESLSDIAKSLKLDVETTKPLVQSGAVYGGARNERAPDIVMPLVPTAFQMQEGKPQIAEVRPGEAFALFEAADIAPSATPPLKDIREDVVDGWRLAEGAKGAKKAADRILKRVRDGSSLAEAVRAEKKPLPRVQPVSLTREELMQQPGSPPLALMFAMSADTAKKLEASGSAGYYLVSLDKITAGKVEKGDPLIQQAATGYGNILSRELGDQLRAAIRKEVGIETNPDAIDTVRRELSGANR
tara:strand:- start:1100 stop:3034 length:1935 start_codon:yes stop_codon:yes gene_type:complete